MLKTNLVIAGLVKLLDDRVDDFVNIFGTGEPIAEIRIDILTEILNEYFSSGHRNPPL